MRHLLRLLTLVSAVASSEGRPIASVAPSDRPPTGYIGVQDSVYGQLQLWLHYFPGFGGHLNLSGAFPWQKGRWYHIALNLTATKTDLYLDGMRLAGAEFARPLRVEELAPFVVGGGDQYAMDDLRIYSRPLLASEIAEIAVGEQVMDGKIAFFPSLPALVLDAVADAKEVGAAPLRLRLADPAESRMLLDAEARPEHWRHTQAGTCQISRKFSLPRLAEGKYKAWIEAEAAAGTAPRRMLQRVVTVKHYPWEGCRLGTSDAIIPPFTPLEVEGTTVSCILRRHVLAGLGLWRQVESLGKALLDRPVELHAITGGKADDWAHGPVTFTETQPHRVAFGPTAPLGPSAYRAPVSSTTTD